MVPVGWQPLDYGTGLNKIGENCPAVGGFA
jgi:hypothetical protein